MLFLVLQYFSHSMMMMMMMMMVTWTTDYGCVSNHLNPHFMETSLEDKVNVKKTEYRSRNWYR